jgi:hypothetical protein
MRRVRTFCLVLTLAVAQVALARAAGTGTGTFTTLSCAMPLVAEDLGTRVQCIEPSGTAAPSGGVAVRRQESGTRIRPRAASPFTTLQMNLCNSGIAGCFTGRASAKARQLVLDRAPALVTVNEACESDVTEQLLPAMLSLYPNEWLFWTFAPAAHRGTRDPVLCTPEAGGKERGRFGNGAVGRLLTEARPRFAIEGGLFPDDRPQPGELQDRAHAELRSWVCARANRVYRACTTHLDNPSATGAGTPEHTRVASNQCRFLTTSIQSDLPTVVLGDLNLDGDATARYNVLGCLPQGWSRGDDGSVQHVLASNGFGAVTAEVVSMGGTTDHPALLTVFRFNTAPALVRAAPVSIVVPLDVEIRPQVTLGGTRIMSQDQASRVAGRTLGASRAGHWEKVLNRLDLAAARLSRPRCRGGRRRRDCASRP